MKQKMQFRSRPAPKRGDRILTCVLGVFAFLWVLPLIAGFLTSFKSNLEVKKFARDMNLIPHDWTLENYRFVLNYPAVPIFRVLFNTLIVCAACVVFVLILCTMSAYAFERFAFRGKEILFWSLFSLSAIPNVVALVPQYSMYRWLGWIDHLPSIIAPTITDVFFIFLIRQFMRNIPRELDESARIDGASEWKIFLRIIVPLLAPVLTLVAIFKFSSTWNDFLWPSIAITTPTHATITPALRLLNDANGIKIERSLAGCIVAMIPTLVVFLAFRRQFLKGLDISSGIKG